ncbi:uncharacterized protein LOC114536723 [Dendronephthya gigantea]|uniref:uncharacterized protein LOC114536723 n=1 Tax=Dendronephthya gigantea TaxID=151771 RepID=UPI00106ADEDD|nr:uncharacterized protein LOC114536723 [Dendronephthya gigantea]
MQEEKWNSQDNIDSDEQEFNSDELDEVLEIRMNKTRARLSQNLENGDDQNEPKGIVVLTQRLHREATTRTKRAQRMQEAYRRSNGMASYTPEKTGYARVVRDNGSSHWTIRRK